MDNNIILTIGIVLIIIISVGIIFLYSSQKETESETESETKSETKSATEQVLESRFSNKEKFTATDESESIWREIQKHIPDSFTSGCTGENWAKSGKCYISYQDYKKTPLEDDKAIALLLLDFAYTFETNRNNPRFIEEMSRNGGISNLTDMLSYDTNTKKVNVKKKGVLDLDIGTYDLKKFMEAVPKVGKANENNYVSCMICGKDYISEEMDGGEEGRLARLVEAEAKMKKGS